ncbi:MAG: ATP synthase F1 subunit gamma [Bacteroidota bacterium]|nr:ATP synthase F1 subunit gamma [Bacteroidota bacterium]
MANLKEVKNRINSVKSTQQITKAMKMVAASKLRRAQDRIIQMRPYAEKLNTILQNVSSGSDSVSSAYNIDREVNSVLFMTVTSDKGLAGAFNSNVFRAANYLMQTQYKEFVDRNQLYILPIGKKSVDYYAKRKLNIINDYSNLFGSLSFDKAREAAEFAMKGFIEGRFDKVILIYNEFKNVATQVLRSEQFLPVVKKEADPEVKTANIDYIFEPSKEYIIEELIPTSIKIQFYKALLESNAAEHGARMTAMDKATDNAGELLKELKLTYNRTRQAAITKEILEIVGGAEALASS